MGRKSTLKQWVWDSRKERAAALFAEGGLSNNQVAAQVGVSPRVLRYWKEQPAFFGRIGEVLAEARKVAMTDGITKKANRLLQLRDKYERMQAVIDARATDREFREIPGYKQGILVHSRKMIGKGETAEVVDEYAVDTGLLREMREWMKQAAQEVGDWTEKSDVTSQGSKIKAYTVFSPDDWDKPEEDEDAGDAPPSQQEEDRGQAGESGGGWVHRGI